MKLKFIILRKPAGVVIRSIGTELCWIIYENSSSSIFLSYYFAALVIHPTWRASLRKGRYLHPVWVYLPLQNIRASPWLQQELLLSWEINTWSQSFLNISYFYSYTCTALAVLDPKLCDSEWLMPMHITANCFKSKLVACKVCTIWARFLLVHLWGFGLFVLVEWLSGFLFVFPVQDVWNNVRSVLQPNRANVLRIAINFHPRKV